MLIGLNTEEVFKADLKESFAFLAIVKKYIYKRHASMKIYISQDAYVLNIYCQTIELKVRL